MIESMELYVRGSRFNVPSDDINEVAELADAVISAGSPTEVRDKSSVYLIVCDDESGEHYIGLPESLFMGVVPDALGRPIALALNMRLPHAC